MTLTVSEQRLIFSMLNNPITSKTQKIYKNKVSFYRAIWKLRDMELVTCKEITQSHKKIKIWSLTIDGVFLARILKKG